MKKVLESLFGPLGPVRDLSPGLGPEFRGWRRGYVPTDQRRAVRVFWMLLGAIVAVNVLVLLAILAFRAAS